MKKIPEHFATRIPRGFRGSFTEEPFKVLPGNTIFDEPFDAVEDDSIALVAMELGLFAKNPVEILIAVEDDDLETALVGLENDAYGRGSVIADETTALVTKFSGPKVSVRSSRPVFYRTEPPKPSKGFVAALRYNPKARCHVLGREAEVVMSTNQRRDVALANAAVGIRAALQARHAI